MTVSNQILEANLLDDRPEDTYLDRPFHQRRIKIALGMLRDAFQASAADQKSRGLDIQRPRGIELGSSTGETAAKIRDMGADVIACDAEETALATAQENFGLETEAFDVSKSFPFENDSLDFIYAAELIEHVFDTRHFLAECNRVLKPQGTLVLTTPNLATLRDRFRFIAGHSPRQVNPMHEYLDLHIRQFTGKLLKECLQESGFDNTLLRSQSVGIPLLHDKQGNSRQKELRLLGRLFPDLGGSLITSSRKRAAPTAPALQVL